MATTHYLGTNLSGQEPIEEVLGCLNDGNKYYDQEGNLITDPEQIKKFLDLMNNPPEINRNIIDWSIPANRF